MNWSEVAIPDYPEELRLVYVAGPMSNVGPPTWNYPAFQDMTAKLRAAGHRVIGPHELHEPSTKVAWDWYLRRDLTQLVKCSDVFLLPGWGASKGASLEHHVAKTLGMSIHYPGESLV